MAHVHNSPGDKKVTLNMEPSAKRQMYIDSIIRTYTILRGLGGAADNYSSTQQRLHGFETAYTPRQQLLFMHVRLRSHNQFYNMLVHGRTTSIVYISAALRYLMYR